MSKKAVAGLVLAWGILTTVAEKLCEHAIFTWILEKLESVLPGGAEVIAMIAAYSIPGLITAAVVIFVFYWGRHLAQQEFQPAGGPFPVPDSKQQTAITPDRFGTRNIVIKPSRRLREMNLEFWLLHVKDGKDEVNKGPPKNEKILFKELDDRGAMMAQVTFDLSLGFQFKCFARYSGYSFAVVKRALEDNGFRDVTEGDGDALCAWFLLPEYKTYRTFDPFTNNFFYPV